MGNIFNKDFQEFLQIAEIERLEYILVGGYSVILHGYQRSTGDMDVWVNPTKENFTRLMSCFSKFGLPTDVISLEHFLDVEKNDVFGFGKVPYRLEILTLVKGLDFIEAFSNIDTFEIEDGIIVCTLNIEDLRKAKKAAGRYRDLDDLEHLNK